MIELGRAVGEILVTLVTRPGDLAEQVVESLRNLGNSLATIFDSIVTAGAGLLRGRHGGGEDR